jgi:hypothetical protein
MPKKKSKYTTDAEIGTMLEERNHAEFMSSMKRLASAQGLPLEEWMRIRNQTMQAQASAEKARYGSPAEGPVLDGSQPWHREYSTYCMASIQRILAGTAKKYDVALHVLKTWGPLLSPSAVSKWSNIADEPDQPAPTPITPHRTHISRLAKQFAGPYIGPHTRRPIQDNAQEGTS